MAASERVFAADAMPYDAFGYSFAVDSGRMLVGCRGADVHGGESGACYAFVRNGSWLSSQKLCPSSVVAGDEFGHAVAMSTGRAFIGAPRCDAAGINAGAVWWYERIGDTWVERTRILAPYLPPSAAFGTKICASSNWIAVSAPRQTTVKSNDGAVHLFRWSGIGWIHQFKLTVPDAVIDDQFGNAVAMSDDWLVVGCRNRDSGGIDSGAVFVYHRDGPAWTLSQTLRAPDGLAGDSFGQSVAIDNDMLVIGAHRRDSMGVADAGGVYVFRLVNASWAWQATLGADSAGAGDWLGWSVSVENGLIAGSAVSEAGSDPDVGAIHVFADVAGVWHDVARVTLPNAVSLAAVGTSVQLTDGVLCFGAPGAFGSGVFEGAVGVLPLNSDCDEDLIPDFIEIAMGAADCDSDTRPDVCQADADLDGTIDACDGCPADQLKVDPGICGCGVTDSDMDMDGFPDCLCPADLSGNGTVDGSDLGIILAYWGPDVSVFPGADINQDGLVNGGDLGILLAAWGLCP